MLGCFIFLTQASAGLAWGDRMTLSRGRWTTQGCTLTEYCKCNYRRLEHHRLFFSNWISFSGTHRQQAHQGSWWIQRYPGKTPVNNPGILQCNTFFKKQTKTKRKTHSAAPLGWEDRFAHSDIALPKKKKTRQKVKKKKNSGTWIFFFCMLLLNFSLSKTFVIYKIWLSPWRITFLFKKIFHSTK